MLTGLERLECPCRWCGPEKRNETCHANCEDFLRWEAAHKARRKAALRQRHVEGQADYRKKAAATRHFRKK